LVNENVFRQRLRVYATVRGLSIGFLLGIQDGVDDCLLGAHIGDRAQRTAHPGELGRVRRLCEPEVQHLAHAIGREHDVRALDVPVHDVLGVGRFQRLGNLNGNPDGFLDFQRRSLMRSSSVPPSMNSMAMNGRLSSAGEPTGTASSIS